LFVNVNDGTIRMWQLPNWHPTIIFGINFSTIIPNYISGNIAIYENIIAVISSKNTTVIEIWNIETQKLVVILEEHTAQVTGLVFSKDGNLLFSKSHDNTVGIWRCNSWKLIGSFGENSGNLTHIKIDYHPHLPILVTRGKKDRALRVWRIDHNKLKAGDTEANSILYTTAKLVLVGDSGIGKTTLGWRLAYNVFIEHESTHGQQFWIINELGIIRSDGTNCEAVLWDLAGQPDYRLVHSLFLDNVDLALLFYESAGRQDSLTNALFWLKHLRKQNPSCPIILIGARADRGSPDLTKEELEKACKQHNIVGGFIATSAKTGEGIEELKRIIKRIIPWDHLQATSTNTTFKKIKEFVLSLKERATTGKTLVSPSGLQTLLEELDSNWKFSQDEIIAAIRNLGNHGYITMLYDSKGMMYILLAPHILINLASSFVLEARRNPRGLGVLEEQKLLKGEYAFPELAFLNNLERDILLDATTVLFLERTVCFRETFNDDTFLVFPSLINEKHPLLEDIEVTEDVSYLVKGATENVYASLVVLLGYTNVFTRTNQWHNQAQYQVGNGEICGFKQVISREGEIEFVLYYILDIPSHIKLLFQGLFERFLSRTGLVAFKYQPVACISCGEKLNRNIVINQLEKNRNFSYCNNCGEKLTLPERQMLTFKQDLHLEIQTEIATLRTRFESAIIKVKAFVRDNVSNLKPPKCFISYAWGNNNHEQWVLKMAEHLKKAGIEVILDQWSNPPGSSISKYIEEIGSSEFVIVVGTSLLKEKYTSETKDSVVTAELKLINTRLRQSTQYGKNSVIPILLEGDEFSSFTPLLQDLVYISFQTEEHYFFSLFKLIWHLYKIPPDNPFLAELQKSMISTFVRPDKSDPSPYFLLDFGGNHSNNSFLPD
ncbi:MAG: TIR domain-containing protein, partial [Chitinophagaceae bacterium]